MFITGYETKTKGRGVAKAKRKKKVRRRKPKLDKWSFTESRSISSH